MYRVSLWFLQPFSIDIAEKTCKHLQCTIWCKEFIGIVETPTQRQPLKDRLGFNRPALPSQPCWHKGHGRPCGLLVPALKKLHSHNVIFLIKPERLNRPQDFLCIFRPCKCYWITNIGNWIKNQILHTIISFSWGQRNLIKVFHKDTSTALITKIALKTFLNFVSHRR